MVHLPSQDLNAIASLASALRGEACAVSRELVDLAEGHRVDALLARAPAASTAPAAVASRLNALAAANEAFSAAQDRELTRVLASLAAGGVSPVLIKGAHLAHTIYPSSASRPRGDTDVVIAADELTRLTCLLDGAGYRRLEHVRGALILGQCHFRRTDDLGVTHGLDVHWRVAAPLVFRRVLPAAALRQARVAIPALGAHAWGPCAPHALIVACVHLIAHHRADTVLIWLYDIARLAETLDRAGAAVFLETAAAGRISAVCTAALERARRHFDGPALTSLAGHAAAQSRGASEPSARLLDAARPIDEVWLDLRTADGWHERVTLLREHLWPDAGYMRATAPGTRWLPYAYARRALVGARRWISPRDGVARDASSDAPVP
jgi:hypothetical protein